MSRRAACLTVSLLVLCLGIIRLLNPFGTKPLSELEAEQIETVYMTMTPPQKTVEVTEQKLIGELTEILNKLVLYREDESGQEYAGQLVEAKVILRDGTIYTVGIYHPFLIFNGKCYRTKYQPCEAFNRFGNQLLDE